jgi:hypothetical protein
MAQNVKDVGKGLACVVLFLLLYLVVGFSFDRSSGLAILLALLLFWRAFKPPHFEPYWVQLEPNWYQLLLDYGLVKDLEEWQRILATFNQVPAPDYSVLRDGIRFTVLNPGLIYRNDHREFATHLNFTEPIGQISLLSSGGWWYHPDLSIGFATLGSADGAYKICVTAPDSAKHTDRDENGRAVVALLPWAEFGIYREDRGDVKRLVKWAAKRDKQVQEHGWTQDEAESDHRAPTCIKHKYLTVQHKRI